MDDKLTRSDIVNAVDANRGFFEGPCRTFADRVGGYAARLIDRSEKQRAAILKRLGDKAFHGNIHADGRAVSPADAFLAEEATREPPEPGWVWDAGTECCEYLDWKAVRSLWLPHWRPADDVNPLLWFATAGDIAGARWYTRGAKPAREDEGLHDAVLLAIAHDSDESLVGRDPRIFDAVPPVDLWPREDFFRKVNDALLRNPEPLRRAWGRIVPRLPGAVGDPSDVPVTDDEMEVLYTLDERETLTQNDAIGRALKDKGISRADTTVKMVVKSLIDKGLVERPKPRSGVRITQDSQLVTPIRLAKVLRIPADWLTQEARAGRLPHVNACGRLLFNPDAVERVLADRAAREGLAEGQP